MHQGKWQEGLGLGNPFNVSVKYQTWDSNQWHHIYRRACKILTGLESHVWEGKAIFDLANPLHFQLVIVRWTIWLNPALPTLALVFRRNDYSRMEAVITDNNLNTIWSWTWTMKPGQPLWQSEGTCCVYSNVSWGMPVCLKDVRAMLKQSCAGTRDYTLIAVKV